MKWPTNLWLLEPLGLVARGKVELAVVIARHCILNPAYIRAL